MEIQVASTCSEAPVPILSQGRAWTIIGRVENMAMRSAEFILSVLLAGAEPMDTADSILGKARSVLAQLDGQITVPGLGSPVEVLRDRWGVPHIYAQSQDDLFLAQGFVAAQDRLFQMDVWRRLAVGEMAEAFGERFLEHDRLARLVRYRGDMEAEWSSYSPDARRIAEAFTAGVNAGIDHHATRCPVEFQILGIRPKKWQAQDILGRMSGIVMARNFDNEIARAELIGRVGLEMARRLAPTDPSVSFAPAEGLDLAGIDLSLLAGYRTATGPLQLDARDAGSNNWVIDGTLSASGKPMLANDPHRALGLPALRYLVHLSAPGWNCIGGGEPALPGVAIGHNERIAWGMTIVGTDQSDVYVEATHPDDPTRYRVGDRWEEMRIVRETVAVRGRPQPVEVELRFTRHGPVFHQNEQRHRAFALRWVGNEPGGAAYLGCLAIDRAQNWQEFRAALAAWKTPSENLVYADVDGNIGWTATALTPIRNWDGLLPVPGDQGRYEWQGFLPVAQLPAEFNPPRHYIVTANYNILPPGYPHAISYEWAQPYRAARLRQRFEDQVARNQKFTLADSQRMQHDSTSLPGRRLARLAQGLAIEEPNLVPFVKLLAGWDGELSRQSQAGPLYGFWLQELIDAFFGPPLAGGPPASEPLMRFLRGNRGLDVMLEALETADPGWFGEPAPQRRNELLGKTLSAAVRRAKEVLGEVENWTWGRLHTASFHHALGSLGPAFAQAFNLGPVPRPGDGYTPHAARHNDQFGQEHGASYRQIFDLADWDRGLVTSVPGQSGQPASPHYADLLPLWTEGEYFPLPFSRPAIEAATIHRLVLKPTP